MSRLAGELRAAGEPARLTRFGIRLVRQTTVAVAEAEVYMEGHGPAGIVHGVFRVLAERGTEDGELAMPS